MRFVFDFFFFFFMSFLLFIFIFPTGEAYLHSLRIPFAREIWVMEQRCFWGRWCVGNLVQTSTFFFFVIHDEFYFILLPFFFFFFLNALTTYGDCDGCCFLGSRSYIYAAWRRQLMHVVVTVVTNSFGELESSPTVSPTWIK